MNPSTQMNAMLSSTPRQAGKLRRPATRIPTVCVVDPKANDYQGWLATAEASRVRIQIVGSAEEALRFARNAAVDVWVVNTDLPGLSGLELCGMLKSKSANTAVYMVADEYSPTIEQAAWQARATLFGYKGDHLPWLAEWLQSRRGREFLAPATPAQRALSSP